MRAKVKLKDIFSWVEETVVVEVDEEKFNKWKKGIGHIIHQMKSEIHYQWEVMSVEETTDELTKKL
jgi:hypothetical protein